MARISLELPEDLLFQVDRYARRAEESREEFLCRIVGEGIEQCHATLRAEMEQLLLSHPLDLGGKTAAELIREGRDSR